MKTTTIILTVIVVLAATMVTSCEQSVATETPGPPPGPDPMQVLEEQVCAERKLRQEAEARAESEAGLRNRWELGALGLGSLAVVAFFAGTAIGSGSKGSRHAGSST